MSLSVRAETSGPLLPADELARLLDGAAAERPTLLDVRWQLGGPNGRGDYEHAHIPGAAFVDLDAELSGPVRPDRRGGRHPMPAADSFGAAMRRAGVRQDRAVVCYDAGNSLPASRAWWLLRYFGKRDVRVLDGGFGAWQRSGGPTEAGPASDTPGDFRPSPGHWPVLDADAAAALASTGLLLDARTADRYRGENETVDPVAGHIPGAQSVPALDSVGPDGRFRPLAELVERFRAAGIGADSRVGTYCGSGVQAAHLALALSATGVADQAEVYVGSWSDWISDSARPVAQ